MKRGVYILLFLIAGCAGTYFYFYTPSLPLPYLKEKYTSESSEFIRIDGLDVHYRRQGEGPVLVLLHGTASSLHTWDAWTARLKEDFTVIRLDLPAFGLTGPNSSGLYSYQFYVSFLNQFLKALKVETFSLAGNSLGGAIAWNYALAYPDDVEKLILVDASGYPQEGRPVIMKLATNPLLSPILKNITPRSLIKNNIREVYYKDQLITPELVTRYYELQLRKGNRQAFIDRANTRMNDQSSKINLLKMPVLIQWGRYDEWISIKNGFRFQSDIDQSTLIIYEAGHVPMEEIPYETVKDAVNFLQEKKED